MQSILFIFNKLFRYMKLNAYLPLLNPFLIVVLKPPKQDTTSYFFSRAEFYYEGDSI